MSIAKLKSSHAIRIYELLIQWRTKGSRIFPFEWLRSVLELESSYSTAGTFKTWVIEPAIKQINLHTDISITRHSYQKTGRQISSVTINFRVKGERRTSSPPNLEMFPVGRAVNPVEAEIDLDPSKKLRELEASTVKTTVDSETTAV
jgi:plasmid replication initiation protein